MQGRNKKVTTREGEKGRIRGEKRGWEEEKGVDGRIQMSI
jgi:hypothetical protein